MVQIIDARELVNWLCRVLLAATAVGGVFGSVLTATAETIAVAALATNGSSLGTMTTEGDIDDLRFSVDLAGDTPDASYVWAIMGGGGGLQRTKDGYWVPWNGDTAQLIDNGFHSVDGKLTFKVLDHSIDPDNHGITLGIGYRTGGVLKFGIYGILPANGGS